MGKSLKKVHGHQFIDRRWVKKRMAASQGMGYDPAKYLLFIEQMLAKGYKVSLHEAYNTRSKYVTVHGAGDVTFKVRFSNHKPIHARELKGDCDFFVGVTHTGVRTTVDAIRAVEDCFNAL